MINAETRVYVLGAGCSYDTLHGYPLAKDFAPALQSYSTKIASLTECQRIPSPQNEISKAESAL